MGSCSDKPPLLQVLRSLRMAAPEAGFDGRDLVGRDLVACSRFWARDRVATAVVRGASPFWKSSFVRATNRHGRDHPANLPLSLGVVGRSRRVAEALGVSLVFTSRRSWPLGKGPLSSSRRECRIKIPKRLPFGARETFGAREPLEVQPSDLF